MTVPAVVAAAVAVVVAAAGWRTWIRLRTSTAVAAVAVVVQYLSRQINLSQFAEVAVQLLQKDYLQAFVGYLFQKGSSTAVGFASGSVEPRITLLQQACSALLQRDWKFVAAAVSGLLMRQTVHRRWLVEESYSSRKDLFPWLVYSVCCRTMSHLLQVAAAEVCQISWGFWSLYYRTVRQTVVAGIAHRRATW